MALTPGPAWPVDAARATASCSRKGVVDLAMQARRLFPEAQISVERFGNPLTARAVASGSRASEVAGVAIDHHDEHTAVIVALLLSGSGPPR